MADLIEIGFWAPTRADTARSEDVAAAEAGADGRDRDEREGRPNPKDLVDSDWAHRDPDAVDALVRYAKNGIVEVRQGSLLESVCIRAAQRVCVACRRRCARALTPGVNDSRSHAMAYTSPTRLYLTMHACVVVPRSPCHRATSWRTHTAALAQRAQQTAGSWGAPL